MYLLKIITLYSQLLIYANCTSMNTDPLQKKKETLGRMPIITYPSHIHYASLHEWGVILDGGNSGEETDEKKDDYEEKRQRRRDVLDQASRSLHSRG